MKRNVRFLPLALALCVLLFPVLNATAATKIPSPSRYFYVYDGPSVLSLTTEDHIVEVNERLYDACGAQIVIACVETTGDMDIADYAEKMFNQWKIGSREEKNGVLVLMSVAEEDYYAVQGKGLENLLSSGTLKLMLDEYLEPHFAAKDYDAGALAIFDALAAFISDIYPSDYEHSTVATEPVPSADDGDYDFDSDLEELFDEEIPSFLSGFSVFNIIGNVLSAGWKLIRGAAKLLFIVVLILLVLRIFFGGGGGKRSKIRGFILPFLAFLHLTGGSSFKGSSRSWPFGGGFSGGRFSGGGFSGGFSGGRGGSHGGGGFTRGGGVGRR